MNLKPSFLIDNDNARVTFIDSFQIAQRSAYGVNYRNGWWADRDMMMASGMPNAVPMVMLGCLGLVTSEVAEAMEAARKHEFATWGDTKSKDTLVRELAGTVIRCMDIAERFDLRLAEAIVEEIKANAERGFRHGGKAA